MSYITLTEFVGKYVVFFILIIVAFFINELPSSSVLQSLLPDWPFLVMLLLSVSMRWQAGVVFAFVVGMLQDLFLGTPLGIHAGIYTVCSYVISQYRKRFQYTSMVLQTLIVGMLVLIKVVFVLIANSFVYALPGYYWSFLSVPLSMFGWVLLTWIFYAINKAEVG